MLKCCRSIFLLLCLDRNNFLALVNIRKTEFNSMLFYYSHLIIFPCKKNPIFSCGCVKNVCVCVCDNFNVHPMAETGGHIGSRMSRPELSIVITTWITLCVFSAGDKVALILNCLVILFAACISLGKYCGFVAMF